MCELGICVERSLEMIVGILGILKAGGAYVPLDPNNPQERLNHILEDAQVQVLVTNSQLRNTLAQSNFVVYLDEEADKITQYPRNNLVKLPNGMTIAHLNKTETEFLYQEIFTDQSYLQHGITLDEGDCIFDVGANIGLFSLFAAQACPKVKIYAFEPIPPVFELLRLNAELYNLDAKVFNIGLSGETKSAEFTYYPNVSVISGRFADASEEKEVVKSFLLKQQAVTVNGTTVSQEVLDELLVERLHSERFTCQLKTISQLIEENQIERIDLLKIDVEKSERDVLAGIQERDWLKIQEIIVEVHDINGRLTEVTDLLKFYGYDLTIVQDKLLEATPLYNIYGRRTTIKQRFPQKTGAKSIGDRESTWNSLEKYIQDLRHYLKQKLPEYMIPSAFVVLEKFPLTSNGKVDSRALPIPENFKNALEFSSFVAPSTPTQEILANLWAAILSIEKVGIYDNFFDLGGHSLLATSLLFRIRQAFAIDFPLRCLFETPTIAALSKLIESFKAHPILSSNGIPSTMLAISRLERSPSTPVPLSLSQQGLWSLHQSASMVATLNSSTLMRVRGSFLPEVVEQSFNEIVRRHENLRTVFTVINDQPMQIVLPHLHLPLIYENLQHLPPEVRESEAVRLGIKIRQQPFNLAVAPLIRTALFQLNPDEHWLVITMHHMITDGWSFSVLLQELDALMQAFANGRPSPLPALSCQYADFALWQQQVYNESAIAQQLSYWQRKLVDDELHPSPSLMLSSKQAGHRFIHLPESLVRSVEGLGRSQRVTSFVILLSAFKLVLAKWNQQNEILILATLGNRTGPDTERMIGCFINDVILRSLILPEQTGSTVIKQLQETVNEAIEHKEVQLHRVINQIQHLRPLNLLASITMTPSVQDQMPGWEAIASEQWGDIPMELYGKIPPLELYVELSKTIRIRAKYGTEKFTAETIDRLLNNYQQILTKLVSHSEMTVSDLFKTIHSYPTAVCK
ncbi:MAG: FkbM family methyltransferase [Nostoc sp.]|uniref:FkbM family methyltransferase n=1 Tax=Nostoc sp. TaxID=1180 RepID=UPI002FF319E9